MNVVSKRDDKITITKSKRSISVCNFTSTIDMDTNQSKKTLGNHHLWTISDAIELEKKKTPMVKLPLKSFNHIAREVISIKKSRNFYVDVLGFTEIPRPPFDCEGYWLSGYGLSLHIVASNVPEYRRELKRTRINHFSNYLPQVDHIAFVTEDIEYIREVLDKAQVYYKLDSPCEGISQLFLFDPDGNVIEVSNCHHTMKRCPFDLSTQALVALNEKISVVESKDADIVQKIQAQPQTQTYGFNLLELNEDETAEYLEIYKTCGLDSSATDIDSD